MKKISILFISIIITKGEKYEKYIWYNNNDSISYFFWYVNIFCKNGVAFFEIIGYKRTINGNKEIYENPVLLTDKLTDGVLIWDVPEGLWRIYIIFKRWYWSDRGRLALKNAYPFSKVPWGSDRS